MRDPSVTFAVGDSSNYLVVDSPDRNDTMLITLDPERGYPSFSGFLGVDIFPNKEKALENIQNKEKHITKEDFYMIGGIFQVGNATIICFISKVKFVGQMFKKHNIFKVTNMKFAIANKITLKSQENRVFSYLNSFVKNGLIICHTKDISIPLQGSGSDSCIWNKNIKKPFDFIKIGTVCPSIIQGSFASTIFSDYEMYSITRINCASCLPFKLCRGTNNVGVSGNTMYVENVISKGVGSSQKFSSFVFCRSTTPISFQKGKLIPDQIPHSTLHVWLHTLAKVFDIERFSIIDIGHSQCSIDSEVSKKLNEAMEFVKANFDVTLFQFDWKCKRRGDLKQCVQDWIQFFNKIIDDFTFTTGFVDNEKTTYTGKQNQAIVLTSPNGIDTINIVSFLSQNRIVSKEINEIGIGHSYNLSIIGFFATSTIESGDIIAYASEGTESISHNDINMCVSSEIAKNCPQQNTSLIYTQRERNANNNDIKLFINALFFDKTHKLTSNCTFPAISTEMRCVSLPPVSFVISPESASQILYHKRTVLKKEDGPLVIALTEPCYIDEIIITLPPLAEGFTAPSTFTLYGGAYLNQMIPIFDYQAVPIGETNELSFRTFIEQHYSQESIAPMFSPVRFVSIFFETPFDSFVIDGIKIYGSQSPREKDLHRRSSYTLPPITKEAEFDEEPTHEVSLKWEERRLCALMPLNDYLISVAKKGINPGLILSATIFKLHASVLFDDQQNICSVCGKKASFRCGLCKKKFCRECSNENDSHDQISDPHNRSKLCNACSERRFKLLSSITRLVALKTRMVTEKYPFLFNEDSFFTSNSPMVLNQVSRGSNNVVIEEVVNSASNSDSLWCPEETLNRVDFAFKQNVHIKGIHINCSSNFLVIVNDNEKFEFSPPGNTFELNITCRTISILVVGENISISHISFITEASEEKIVVNDSVCERMPIRISDTSAVKFTYESTQEIMKQTIFFSYSSHAQSVKCYGIDFNEIDAIKRVLIYAETEYGPKYMIFCIPKIKGAYSIFFSESLKCSSLIIWYVEGYKPHLLPFVRPILY